MKEPAIIRIPEIEIYIIVNHIVYISEVGNDNNISLEDHELHFKPHICGYYNIYLSDGTLFRINNELFPKEKLIESINRYYGTI